MPADSQRISVQSLLSVEHPTLTHNGLVAQFFHGAFGYAQEIRSTEPSESNPRAPDISAKLVTKAKTERPRTVTAISSCTPQRFDRQAWPNPYPWLHKRGPLLARDCPLESPPSMCSSPKPLRRLGPFVKSRLGAWSR